MVGFLFYVTSALFFSLLIEKVLSWIRLWEEKEFNVKRLLIHLIQTRQGLNVLFGPVSIFKWLLIFSYAITIFYSGIDNYYHAVVFTFYLILFLNLLRKIYIKEFLLPQFSIASFSIAAFSILFAAILYLFPPLDRFLWMLILDSTIPIVTAIFVLIASVFFDFNTDIIINRALKKIKNHKNLLVIAVVGSYGKGTTKEFIARVLKTKFNVLETSHSFNTTLGIARTIIKNLTPKKQIFVAEMDDHKFGDIGDMCNMVIPKIAVVTGINDQSFSLFGSENKILESKAQVLEALPSDGIALFNGESKGSQSLYKSARNKKFIYGNGQGKNYDIASFGIRETRFTTSFSIEVFNKTYRIENLKLIGKKSIENILPAIFIGLYVGIDFLTIRQVLKGIRPLQGTMDPKIFQNKVTVVDDTYSSSFTSVMNALDYMKIYKGKKIIVLEPLTELGKNAKKDHFLIGEEIGKVCDILFLTNSNYKKDILNGIKNSGGRCKVMFYLGNKIASYLTREGRRDDVMVLEGREAKNTLSFIELQSPY